MYIFLVLNKLYYNDSIGSLHLETNINMVVLKNPVNITPVFLSSETTVPAAETGIPPAVPVYVVLYSVKVDPKVRDGGSIIAKYKQPNRGRINSAEQWLK